MQIHPAIFLRLLVFASLTLAALAFRASGQLDASTQNTTSTPTVWGDVTCDNSVDIADVADLMRRSSGIETFSGCAAEQGPVTLRLDPARGSTSAGGSIVVSIYSHVHQPDIGLGYGAFDLVFDERIVTPVLCTVNQGGCNPEFAPGRARFTFVSAVSNGWPGTRKLGSVEFLANGTPGQASELTFQSIELGDQLGRPISGVSSVGAAVSILPPSATPAASPTPTPAPYWAYADINCDDSISVLDALGVLEYVAFGEARPPAPPNCRAIGS